MGFSLLNDVHGPSAVMSARFPLAIPGRGSPPVAVRYTSVAFAQEYSPLILKLPFESVVTVFVSRGVARVRSPVVPMVYSSMVAFETACEPPSTVPVPFDIEGRETELDEPHPDRRIKPKSETKNALRIGTTDPP
jgi:hypothetical protein